MFNTGLLFSHTATQAENMKRGNKMINKTEATQSLQEFIKAGETVYTILRHRSASGMTRWLDLYVIRDNQPRRITFLAAKALGYAYDTKYEALKVGGCGMDMGFHAVYCLSSRLFPEGFAVEGTGRNGDMSGWDKDGGYALRHEWL